MPSGKPYDPHVKAAAMAALMAGESPSAVAEQHGIPVATVRAWRQRMQGENIIAHHEKREQLGQLVATYLEESLVTLAAQARFARDEAWLAKQNAADVAVMHGVLNDKIVRLLAAMQPAESSADGGDA